MRAQPPYARYIFVLKDASQPWEAVKFIVTQKKGL